MADKIVFVRDYETRFDRIVADMYLKCINELIEGHEAGTLDKRTIMNARRLLPSRFSMTLEKQKEAA